MGKYIEYNNEEYLIENWTGSITPVKKWMRKNRNYECSICKNSGIHMDIPLSLQIDHINGINNDNRKENLRWLCPNCHTQTKTYSGNNKCVSGRVSITKENILKYIDSCENINQLLIKIGASNTNSNYKTIRKIFTKYLISFKEKNRETEKELFVDIKSKYDISEISRLVWEIPMSKVCKRYNISANGLKKICKRNNISFPSNGYWQRINVGKTHEESLIKPIRKERKIRIPATQDQLEIARKLYTDSNLSIRKIAKMLNLCRNSLSKHLL